ncbi:thrombospondin type 1 domain-containing protein [Besnoitia besnoiti]|uniref:Thrombospondin type 1 domain-containing protein n=1 Tax=Besnoitia besnoiti TaxID=94643 RepID=A0A2A9M664_BESBE|nr:thrombospondin type 1 domain-containing protein [Besnoitia besnoiti]PFH31376.1 thrombospondin type 1 domain-containing protein [Besnoitia besnoiti]
MAEEGRGYQAPASAALDASDTHHSRICEQKVYRDLTIEQKTTEPTQRDFAARGRRKTRRFAWRDMPSAVSPASLLLLVGLLSLGFSHQEFAARSFSSLSFTQIAAAETRSPEASPSSSAADLDSPSRASSAHASVPHGSLSGDSAASSASHASSLHHRRETSEAQREKTGGWRSLPSAEKTRAQPHQRHDAASDEELSTRGDTYAAESASPGGRHGPSARQSSHTSSLSRASPSALPSASEATDSAAADSAAAAPDLPSLRASPTGSEGADEEEVEGLRGRARHWRRPDPAEISLSLRHFLSSSSLARELIHLRAFGLSFDEHQARARVRLYAMGRGGLYPGRLGKRSRHHRHAREAHRENRGSAEAIGDVSATGAEASPAPAPASFAASRSHVRVRGGRPLTATEHEALKRAALTAQFNRRHLLNIQADSLRFGRMRPLVEDGETAGVYTVNECVAVRYADYPKSFPGYDEETESCKCPRGWIPCGVADAKAHVSAWEPVVWEENADAGCTRERGAVMLEHMNFYSCPLKDFVDYTGPNDVTIRNEQCRRAGFVLCRAAESTCITGPWSAWTSCSVPCGEGYQYRWRIPAGATSDSAGSVQSARGVSKDACAPYHMEERRKCSRGPCPKTVRNTQCLWTTVQVNHENNGFDEKRGSCTCGSGDEEADLEEGDLMVPCTPEEALASMDSWKTHLRKYCHSMLGLGRHNALALRFHPFGYLVRVGLANLWHLDCTGGWTRFNIFEGRMFCNKGAKMLCRASTDDEYVPFIAGGSPDADRKEDGTLDASASMLTLHGRRRSGRLLPAFSASFSEAESSALPSPGAESHTWFAALAGALTAMILLACFVKRATLFALWRSACLVEGVKAGEEAKAFAAAFAWKKLRANLRATPHALAFLLMGAWGRLREKVHAWVETEEQRRQKEETKRASRVSFFFPDEEDEEEDQVRRPRRHPVCEEEERLLRGVRVYASRASTPDSSFLSSLPLLDALARLPLISMLIGKKAAPGAPRPALALWRKIQAAFLSPEERERRERMWRMEREKKEDDERNQRSARDAGVALHGMQTTRRRRVFAAAEGERSAAASASSSSFLYSQEGETPLPSEEEKDRRRRTMRRRGKLEADEFPGSSSSTSDGGSQSGPEEDDHYSKLSPAERMLFYPRGRRRTAEKLVQLNAAARAAAVAAVTPESFGAY